MTDLAGPHRAKERTDSSGWRARFGILVIDKDPVPESEFWAMAPAGVTVHAARFASPRQAGTDAYDRPGTAVAESPDIARGLDQLGHIGLDAICLCFVTGSFLGGPGFDERFAQEASRKAHGTPVITAAQALVTAMRELDVKRPLLVIPPWFKAAIAQEAERYFAAAGFHVAGTLPFDLGIGWRELQPWEIWDSQGQRHVRPEDLYHQVRRSISADADGIAVVGNGLRSIEAIELLERDLGLPVVTSNQAALWHSLRTAGMTAALPNWGRLLS
ncbi:maleate cis-trans isomerase family protein [Streptosporangium sp. NPDC003464]